METMNKINDAITALRLFEEAATKHGEVTELVDYKTCNRNYVTVEKAISFLKVQSELQHFPYYSKFNICFQFGGK